MWNRLKAIEFPTCRACRSSSTVSGSGPPSYFSIRRSAGGWAFWRGSAGQRYAERQIHARFPICRRRSPPVQPSRRGLRRGETFSGVDFETGLGAVEEIRRLLPAGVSMAQFALRWILMHDAVTCAIRRQAARRCGRIARPAILRRCRKRRWPRSAASTTPGFVPPSTTLVKTFQPQINADERG